MSGWPFEDSPDHADLEHTYPDDEDDETAGGTDRQRPGPPDGLSWRHLELYRVLARYADRDGRGAHVRHATLGALLRPPLKPRRVRVLMAGLQAAGWVVAHRQLVQGEGGGRRRGANRYYLTRPVWTLPEQPTVRHSPKAPSAQVAPLGTATRVPNRTSRETASLKDSGAPPPQFVCTACGFGADSTGDLTIAAYSHAGCGGSFAQGVARQLEPAGFDHPPSKGEVLAVLQAGLGLVQVLGEWPNDQDPPRRLRRWRTKDEHAADVKAWKKRRKKP